MKNCWKSCSAIKSQISLTTMNGKSEQGAPKPRFALAIATGLGVGYLPIAPGTFGSLLGVGISWLGAATKSFWPVELTTCAVTSVVGVWASTQVASHFQKKDPQV